MSEILCSTGALIGRANGRNYRLLEGFSKELSCDGYEFMMYAAWYDEIPQLVQTIRSLNLHIPVMHGEKTIGERLSSGTPDDLKEAQRLFDLNCQIATQFDVQKMVLHLWNGPVSDSNIQHNLDARGKLADIAAEYNIDLLVENVVCNHADPFSHWQSLRAQYPDAHFIFDTKMAAFHQQLDQLYQPELAWLWKENRIRHYHINDYAGGYMDWQNLRTLPIGKGHIDFDRFFDFIHTIGYNDTFTIESTAFNSEGVVDLSLLNGQFDYLRTKLK